MAIKKMIKVPDRDPFIGADLNANFVDIDDNFEYLDKGKVGTATPELLQLPLNSGFIKGTGPNTISKDEKGLVQIHFSIRVEGTQGFPVGSVIKVAELPEGYKGVCYSSAAMSRATTTGAKAYGNESLLVVATNSGLIFHVPNANIFEVSGIMSYYAQ